MTRFNTEVLPAIMSDIKGMMFSYQLFAKSMGKIPKKNLSEILDIEVNEVNENERQEVF